MTDMAVTLGGLSLRNPVMTAAGCAASGRELTRFTEVSRLGAFVTPSIMVDARAGLGTPRLAETPSGVISATGLPGPGVAAYVATDLPWLRSVGATVLPSIAGRSGSEYAEVAATLRDSAAFECVCAVEVNLSAAVAGDRGLPAAGDRGLPVASDPDASAKVIAAVRAQLPRPVPVFAKLSPDVTDITTVASACIDAGADGLTLVNAPTGLVIDTDRLRPMLDGVVGGLSGPAIRPLAVRAIWQVREAMYAGRLPTVPIIGVGGVRTGRDALELVAAGACAIQVGTATLREPAAPVRVLTELAALLETKGYARFTDAIAAAHGH